MIDMIDLNFRTTDKAITTEVLTEISKEFDKTSKALRGRRADSQIIAAKLHEQGYYYYNNSIVKVTNNIVELIELSDLNRLIAKNIDNWGLTVTIESNPVINEKNFKNMLEPLTGDFMKDDADHCYFYFTNFILEISKDGIKKLYYKDLDKYIWGDKISSNPFTFNKLQKEIAAFHFPPSNSEVNERNYIKLDDVAIEFIVNNSIFAQFTYNLCTDPKTGDLDTKRLEALQTSLGYLISQYKTEDYAKAIMLTEQNLNETAAGGSGKSLLIKALREVRSVCTIETETEDKYMFDEYTIGTDVIAMDEVPKNFNLQTLYKNVTGDFTIRKKFKDKTTIEFDDAPKFMLATNFLPTRFDDSTARRFVILELYRFYNKTHTPIDDFRRAFFGKSFTSDDWTYFYTYLAICVWKYLNNNNKIYEYEPDSIKERALNLNLDDELVEVFDKLKLNEYISNKDFANMFSETAFNKATSYYLKKKLTEYCQIKNYEIKQIKKQFERGFVITQRKTKEMITKEQLDKDMKELFNAVPLSNKEFAKYNNNNNFDEVLF